MVFSLISLKTFLKLKRKKYFEKILKTLPFAGTTLPAELTEVVGRFEPAQWVTDNIDPRWSFQIILRGVEKVVMFEDE